jgi:hypothetical protein
MSEFGPISACKVNKQGRRVVGFTTMRPHEIKSAGFTSISVYRCLKSRSTPYRGCQRCLGSPNKWPSKLIFLFELTASTCGYLRQLTPLHELHKAPTVGDTSRICCPQVWIRRVGDEFGELEREVSLLHRPRVNEREEVRRAISFKWQPAYGKGLCGNGRRILATRRSSRSKTCLTCFVKPNVCENGHEVLVL